MKLTNLSKQINGKTIFSDLNFTLYPGQICGLIGRNGAGKTTLFRTIANHYQVDSGAITIEGQSLSEDLSSYQKLFYFDEQEHPLNRLTAKQIGHYYHLLYPNFDQENYQQYLVTYRLPEKHHYRSYSKGMKGLLHVIIAFSTGASYLLLDEPFDGLDIIIKKQVIRLILEEVSQRQLALLISSHNLKELENLIERAVILKNQHIINDYHLEDCRKVAVKVQMVFQGSDIPELIQEHCTIISQQGRVITGIFSNLSKDLLTQVKLLKPLLFEELPVSLEDLFIVNLIDEQDYQLIT